MYFAHYFNPIPSCFAKKDLNFQSRESERRRISAAQKDVSSHNLQLPFRSVIKKTCERERERKKYHINKKNTTNICSAFLRLERQKAKKNQQKIISSRIINNSRKGVNFDWDLGGKKSISFEYYSNSARFVVYAAYSSEESSD